MTSEPKEALSPPILDLVSFLGHAAADVEETRPSAEAEPFFLSKISDRASVLYEKIRGAVDNKEEHFLRRHAIRRVVKRIGWLSANPKKIAETLIVELYRGGHLPRRRVSQQAVADIEQSISAFLSLSEAVHESVSVPEFLRLRIALLDIVAGAVEDRLYSTYNEEAVVATLARVAIDSVQGDVPIYSPDIKRALIYIAAWRSMFGADRSLLIYKLWLLEHPAWESADEGSMHVLGKGFVSFVTFAQRLLDNPFIDRLVPRMHNHAIAMTVIYGLVKRYRFGVGTIMEDSRQLEFHVKDTISAMYRRDITRALRRSWRALVYIFFTKGLILLLASSLYLSASRGDALDPLVLLINLLFHPLLLFLITRGLVPPGKANTERLVALIHGIVYGKQLPAITVREGTWGLLGDLALALYVVILSGLLVGATSVLERMQFHVIDIASFILFLVLVVYFGFRIRYTARRMELLGGHEGFFRSLFELTALPLVSLGRWFVTKFERLNVVAIFLDFFIELPLKLTLDFFDAFSRLLREKKEEIYS
ncbi:MAG: hypothetical protein Q7S52_03145 [bacterium]|nr:hypothetical protein [bacterium]